MRTPRFERGQGLVEYALILVVLAVIVITILAFVADSIRLRSSAAFTADVLTVVEDCANANARTSTVQSIDADGLLRCLYAAGITLSQNGDPVRMQEGGS